MAKFTKTHKPRDLPMQIRVCTNCGLWLGSEEAIEGAEFPNCYPKGGEGWWGDPFIPQPPKEEIEWICFCPHCGVDLSDKPSRSVIIMYVDALYPTYPTIEDLVKKIEHIEKEIRTHTAYLNKHKERRASAGLLSSEGIKHEIQAEQLQEEISTLRHELDIIQKELQDKLGSPDYNPLWQR
jgi:hypothetical protein